MFPGAHAATHPDKPALIMGGSGVVMTFKELDDMANRVSQLFFDLGLRPGDHVALCMENHPLYLAVAWGAHYAGLYYTAASSRLTTQELEYIVDDCEAQVFITSMYKAEQAAELSIPNVRLKLMLDGVVDGFERFEDVVSRYPAEPLLDRVEGSDMLYSSGTTGRPKGVKPPLSGAALGTPPPLTTLVTLLFGVDESSTYLSPAPLYHAAPLRFSMAAQRLGATVVVMEHFDPEEFLALIDRYKVTTTQVVPTMWMWPANAVPTVPGRASHCSELQYTKPLPSVPA